MILVSHVLLILILVPQVKSGANPGIIAPTPAFANEVTTVTESFDENGWTSVISYDSGGAENSVTNLYDGTHLCDGYCLEYNRNSGSGYVLRLWWERTDIETFTVDLSGLNNDWDIKYLYTEDKDSGWIANTFTANKHDENPAWEDKEFSYTETSGKFIKDGIGFLLCVFWE